MEFKILLPIDGTELSLHQTRFAIQLALGGLQARFVVANVQEPASFYELFTLRDRTLIQKMSAGAAHELVTPAVELLRGAGVAHDVRFIEDGDAVQGMLDLIESEGCRMVIIGNHDPALLATGRLRSTADRLGRLAPVPVLSVRMPVADSSAS